MRKDYALSTEQKVDAREAFAILKDTNDSLEDAAKYLTQKVNPIPRITIDDAIERFHRSRIKRGLRSSTLEFYRSKLGVFAEVFGEKILDDLTRSQVESWLTDLDLKTKNEQGYYRAICAFLNWSLKQDPPLAAKNVIYQLDIASVKADRTIDILTVEEAQKVMDKAGEYSACLALMLFTGTRPSEIHSKDKPPMLWSQVDFKAKTINILSSQSKTRSARVLEHLPQNLWKFLKAAYKSRTNEFIAPARYRQARKLGKAAIGRWSHDICRHSFFTYHLAEFQDISRTMLTGGHEGAPATMYQNYRGLATKANGHAYYKIKPRPVTDEAEPSPEPKETK